ncbi:hypothetical protein ACN47E_004546 [Coniothyrium glycines]
MPSQARVLAGFVEVPQAADAHLRRGRGAEVAPNDLCLQAMYRERSAVSCVSAAAAILRPRRSGACAPTSCTLPPGIRSPGRTRRRTVTLSPVPRDDMVLPRPGPFPL